VTGSSSTAIPPPRNASTTEPAYAIRVTT